MQLLITLVNVVVLLKFKDKIQKQVGIRGEISQNVVFY